MVVKGKGWLIIRLKDMYDKNAESVVLATLVHHPDYIASSERLLPEYFHDIFNQAVYWGIKQLSIEKIYNIDFPSLDAKIKEHKIYGASPLDKVMCEEFIELAPSLTKDSLEEYKLFVNRVVNSAYKRATYDKIEKIQRLCLKDNTGIQEIQEKFRGVIMELTEKFAVEEDDKLFGEQIQEMWDSTRSRITGNVYGIPSKITKLNEYAPFERSELIVVCAKRKEGKSAYAMSEALHKLEQGHRVLYMDTELRSSQFMERILSNKAHVNNRELKQNNLGMNDHERIKQSIAWFQNSNNFVHIYRPRWTTEMIYSAVLYWKQKIDIDFVVYDYMKSTGATGSSEVYNDLGNLTNFLKNDIAGGFDIPVLSCAQLNRGNDIADSFKIEQYASTILDLRKKDQREIDRDNNLGYGDLGNYKLFVKANRNGASFDDISKDYIDLQFDGEYFDFRNVNIPNQPIEHIGELPY